MSLLKRESNIFYVYAYLDNRKPGKYKYGEYEFDYEPFYIGKGKGKRYQRLDQRNVLACRIINKINTVMNKKPIVIKLKTKLSEPVAFDYEKLLIKLIGRIDLKTGALANFTDGGEGTSGHIHSAEFRRKNSIALKKYHKEACNSEILAKRRKSQSKAMVKLHKDPNSIFNSQEFKEKHKLGNKRKWEESDSIFRTIEYTEKLSIAQKKVWANPKSKHHSKLREQKMSTALKKRWADPNSKLNSVEHRAKITKNNLERWQDPNSGFNSPERRAKIIEANKKAWADSEHYINSKEYRKKLSDRAKRYWNDPNNKIHSEECRKKRNASIKKAWAKTETIDKSRKTHKNLWADPDSKYNSKQCRINMANAKAMDWIIIRPDGVKIKIFNLSKFCRENDLNVAAMHRIAKRKPHNHQHKGWKCQYAREVSS